MFCKKGVLKTFAKFIGKHLGPCHFFNKIFDHGLTLIESLLEPEAVARRCSVNLKTFAKFIGKHLCHCNFIKKETLAQVFFCEFCNIFKNTFFYKTTPVAAPGLRRLFNQPSFEGVCFHFEVFLSIPLLSFSIISQP